MNDLFGIYHVKLRKTKVMKSFFKSSSGQFIVSLALLFSFQSCQNTNSSTATSINMSVKYPQTSQDAEAQDDYHGKMIKDPYRWLEDDNSEETKSWVTAQNDVTFSYLDKIPYRDAIKRRLKKLWNYERYSVPFKEGGKYYYFHNNGLQNQSILYEQLEGDEKAIILDPNTLSEDGTTSLGGYSFSKDGRYLAYQISEGGSDWRKVKVKDLSTGKDLEDELNWVKFSGMSWKGNGFYYSRYPEPKEGDELSARNTNHKLFYHTIGDPQEKDQLIHEVPEHPNQGIFSATSSDESILTIGLWESTSGNALYFMNNKDGKKIPIYAAIEHDFNMVDNIDDQLLILTNYKADNNRIVAVDTNNPEEKNWKDFIPESNDKLSSASIMGDKVFVNYIHKANSLVKVYDLKGNFVRDLKLPGIGSVGGFSGKRGDKIGYFAFTSFTRPTTIYELDIDNLTSKIYKAPMTDFDSELFESKQVWFNSKDGTLVPMFLTYKKGIKLDGQNPTLLYGYGGFDIPILPSFSVQRTVMMEKGAIYAVANIRGGGEFGKQWHLAGTKERKQNVFDDFQAAAEYLIKEKYTSPEKLGIEGRSNGGLLVGACMTQRPDLYAVAFPGVGVLDMLRYDKFTIGRAWSADYGLSENPDEFEYLYAYSPLHNIKKAEYPATMITTADHDDRVVPAHSFKFAANLQAHQQGDNPTLIRIDLSAGHGAGKPTDKKIDEAADMISFMFFNMDESLPAE